MRKHVLVLAGLAAGLVALAGCNNNKSSGSMGATGACCKEGATECTDKAKSGNMGTVSGEKAGCCKSKAAGSMGAVSGECSAAKATCTGK